jgi:hypothetical protein
MAHLSMNCPTCRKQLIHVPHDGLALHLQCAEHGLLILRPVVQLSDVDAQPLATEAHPSAHTHDAA